jgi:hypothetical protein
MEENIPSDKYILNEIFTPLEEAIFEIARRREDSSLINKVHEYLEGDIPDHFNKNTPILYLSRHVATPNYEALRFVEIGKPFGLPLVIGQDTKGKFVSHNDLKKALGKMPVTKGVSRRQDEIIENFTIIDFKDAQGKPFNEIVTKHGKNFVEFHNSFFQHIYTNDIEIADETSWIDRNYRDDLKEQYKRLFALTIAHAVMFESYPDNEYNIVESVIAPAFAEVTDRFGIRPLIVEHISPELELTRDWNGYPSILYQFIKNDIEGKDICE